MNNYYNDQFEEENVFMDAEQNEDSSKNKTKEKENADVVPKSGVEVIRPGSEDED